MPDAIQTIKTSDPKLRSVALIAKPFGFTARRGAEGFFLNQGGDDLMLVRNNGEIVVYEHDANAFLVASRVAAALKADAR